MSETNAINERLAIETLAGTLTSSMRAMSTTAEAQQIAILSLGAVIACLPGTAEIPKERLGAALALLTKGRSKEFTDKLANFMGAAITASQMIPPLADKIAAARATKN